MNSQAFVPITSSRRLAAGIVLALTSACAFAHVTWLHIAGEQPGSGLLALQLGSGARYPANEESIPPSHVTNTGCVDDRGDASALLPRASEKILEMRARVGDARAVACWLELRPISFTLTPQLVDTYFHDVRAPQPVRDYWASQQKAGIEWHEVYRKFVRIELPVPGAPAADALAALRSPRNFPLELVPLGAAPVRARQAGSYQALADGKPVAGLAVEFVSLRSPVGIWRETDANGRVQLALPFGGEWLLRATALDLPDAPTQPWHSRFATLTVQVLQ